MKLGLLQKIIGLLLVVSLATAASVIQPTVDNAAAEGERELSSVGDAARTVGTFNNQRANMNDYMDYVMAGVADWMRAGGVTPFELPDLREGFSYSPLLIEYSGWVDLTNGILHDIENVYRSGDSFMSYDRLLMRIEVDTALTAISFTYDYKTTIMGLGIFDGYVEGSAENIVVHCEFLIDMYDFYIFMQNFEVKSIGYIDVRLRGNLLTDWIGNIMINIITTLFRGTITEMVSDRVEVFVQQTLDKINESRHSASAGANSPVAVYEVLRAAMLSQGIQLPTQQQQQVLRDNNIGV